MAQFATICSIAFARSLKPISLTVPAVVRGLHWPLVSGFVRVRNGNCCGDYPRDGPGRTAEKQAAPRAPNNARQKWARLVAALGAGKRPNERLLPAVVDGLCLVGSPAISWWPKIDEGGEAAGLDGQWSEA